MVIDSKQARKYTISGGEIQFLVETDQIHGGDYCILVATLPAGMVIPLHNHPDPECFFIIEGHMEIYIDDGASAGWSAVGPGDLAFIPGSAKHALRNMNGDACRSMCVTGQHLANFFHDVGRPDTSAEPKAEALARLFAAAEEYHMWMASPAENEAIGLELEH